MYSGAFLADRADAYDLAPPNIADASGTLSYDLTNVVYNITATIAFSGRMLATFLMCSTA